MVAGSFDMSLVYMMVGGNADEELGILLSYIGMYTRYHFEDDKKGNSEGE